MCHLREYVITEFTTKTVMRQEILKPHVLKLLTCQYRRQKKDDMLKGSIQHQMLSTLKMYINKHSRQYILQHWPKSFFTTGHCHCPIHSQSLLYFPAFESGLDLGLTYNQKNTVKVMMCDFQDRVRKSYSASLWIFNLREASC